ncbi:MAG TPA: serine/threonine-protein kinase [Pyrinomonadaceae bacterium]|nr:serine/threonine-protein kinase [Pyrinomonadaceae bacterium]
MPVLHGANQLTASHNYNRDRPDAPNFPLLPDTVLQSRYRIIRQLGRGGMGAVYEAVDQRLEKTVALKETFSSEPSMRKQFEREARLLAGMQHSALPQVSDHFVEGNRAFLVMQFIGGIDLAKIISQQPGPFPRDQVIAWADQLLDALIYLHSRDRQVIHRDIKPHNLKLTATGQIALLDFGLAKAQASDQSVTASQAFFGYTRHYAPLEQIQDQRTDPRSDIYALGATLYHLLTGIKPPDAMVRASAVVNAGKDPLKLADQIHAAVGPQIAAILNKAMAQKPEDRYENATEFREALRRMGRTKEAEARVASNTAGAAALRPTVHISEVGPVRALESSAPNLALVGSARQFGPAGATAVLAVVVTLAGGILYGSQRWFPNTDKLTRTEVGTPAETTLALRQSAARKAERLRTADSPAAPPAKSKNILDGNNTERLAEKRNELAAQNSQTVKRPVAAAKSSVVSSRGPEVTNRAARKNSQRPGPGAPSIRLPNPEFRENTPATSPESRVRSYRSSSAAAPAAQVRYYPSTAPPQFFRAADGTHIVKFSDGSTRFVRPGQRDAQSAGTYR